MFQLCPRLMIQAVPGSVAAWKSFHRETPACVNWIKEPLRFACFTRVNRANLVGLYSISTNWLKEA